MKIAFIGLGVMGFQMAGHLSQAGHDVHAFNRTQGKSSLWAQFHEGTVCSSVREAVDGANLALCCVGDDPDVESVILGQEGMLAGMDAGAVIVDHTTTSANLAVKLHKLCSEKGVGFVDAPVSGGEAGAKNGALTIMCGGVERDFEAAKPAMQAYARSIQLMGGPGNGQLTKMVNQICIAGLIQGLAEGLHFGQRAGLRMTDVVEVISKGAAQSWQMDNRAQTMIDGEYEFGFAVDWMRKDLRICKEQAALLGVGIPVAELVDQFYAEIQSAGGGRWDTSSLMQRLVSNYSD